MYFQAVQTKLPKLLKPTIISLTIENLNKQDARIRYVEIIKIGLIN